VIGTCAWLFWFQALMLVEARYMYRRIPVAHMTPVDLNDNRSTSGEGARVECFGYEFELPWKDIDTQNIQRKNMVLIPFRSGLRMLVGHGSTHDLMDTVMENTKTNPERFRAV